MEFQSFDSFDEMMDSIDEGRKEADNKVQYWQTKLAPGDFFVQTTEYGFLIFGQVLESDDEFYRTEQGKNYRFCRCYSVVVPDGEMGDVHVSAISLAVSEEVFLRFKEKYWIVEDGDSFV